jgi:hypothetical protein
MNKILAPLATGAARQILSTTRKQITPVTGFLADIKILLPPNILAHR